MAEMINSMFTTYARYTCSGAMMMIFFAGLIYISAREERTSVRTILVGGSIVMLLFIFCPTLYLFLMNVGADQAYRRLWWMLPIGVGLGFSATRLVWKHRIKGLLMTAAVLLNALLLKTFLQFNRHLRNQMSFSICTRETVFTS